MTLTTHEPRPAVRRLAFSRLISLVGTNAAFIALIYAVYRQTNSTTWVSVAMVATFAGAGISLPFGGALGDRFDRRRVLIVSDVLGAVTFGVLAFVHAPALMIALIFLAEVVASPTFPAVEAAVPNLAGEELLSWANGMIGFGRNMGQMLGPVVRWRARRAGRAGTRVCLNADALRCRPSLAWTARGRFSEERTAATASTAPCAPGSCTSRTTGSCGRSRSPGWCCCWVSAWSSWPSSRWHRPSAWGRRGTDCWPRRGAWVR